MGRINAVMKSQIAWLKTKPNKTTEQILYVSVVVPV